MYHDIIDVIKNLQTLTVEDSAFRILKDFERVLDDLDMYVFKNWQDGELLSGPHVERYMVTCQFMWPRKHMPDPDGAQRLLDYGCKVQYAKKHILIPRVVRKPEDFRPGTKKGKLDSHPIWVVTIKMPKKLMQDITQGFELRDNSLIADMMQNTQPNTIKNSQSVQPELATEIPQDVQQPNK
jgi:hypothetical protein